MTETITITGTVVAGSRLGRRLGFPTANIALGDDCPVRDGVWAAVVTADGVRYAAVADIGHKPSVGSSGARTLEAHIFGYDGNLYGRTVTVELRRFLRPERRFSSVEALREGIARDCRTAEAYFTENPI